MSLDIWLTQEVDYGGPNGPERVEHFTANITHNLSRMWSQAGIWEALYESDGKTAADILPALEVGCDYMLEHPDECRAHDARNGWGTYKDALPWLQRLIEACRRYPKAEIRVSR